MKKMLLIISASMLFASSHTTPNTKANTTPNNSTHHATWSYTGDTGPMHWGDLKPEYIMCKIGKNQSPIDVGERTIKASLTPLTLHYNVKAKTFLNNGHTLKAKMSYGAKLYVDGKEFDLIQFHFHTPSENIMPDGNYHSRYFPMEAHFVHSTKQGELAVVAVMFKKGKKNRAIQKLIDNMPKKVGEEKNIYFANLKAKDLLPKNLKYYRFNGSLTTPPCSEGVRWFVLKTPVEISEAQIKAFEKVMGKNNRPLQKVNARVILE